MRLAIFDGIRGHLLIGMLVAHLSFNPELMFLQNVHHARLIGLYDAEFFVLIAGLLIGYLWTRSYPTPERRTRFVLRRMQTIYKYYILSALPFLVFSLAAGAGVLALLADIVLMRSGGWFSDILPIYFFCFLLLLPFALSRALYRPLWVIGVSVLIYLGSHLSGAAGVFGYSGDFVVFDIAAWQLVFFVSLVVGGGAQPLMSAIRSMPSALTLLVVGGLVLVFAYLRMNPWYPDPLQTMVDASENAPRMQLHPLYLLRIAIIAALVAIVLIRRDKLLAPVRGLLNWYFSLEIIRNVGKYSIQMFVFHVYIMAFYKSAVKDLPAEQQGMFAVAAILAYIAVPNLVQRRQRAVSA